MSELLKKLLGRVTAVANMCGVKSSTIWRWVQDASLEFPKPIKLAPGTTVWDLHEVAAWIESRKTPPADPENPAATPLAPPPRYNPVPVSTSPTRRKPGRPRKHVAQGVAA